MLFRSQRRESADRLLWRLRIAERVGWIVLLGLIAYLAADLLLFQPTLPTLTVRAPKTGQPTAMGGAVENDPLKPLAQYRESFMARNPFGIAAQRIVGSIGAQEAKSKLASMIGTLTVVGINRGRIPEALIEDSAAKRTFIVKVGEQINELTVKAIDQNGVVVSYEGEETVIQ